MRLRSFISLASVIAFGLAAAVAAPRGTQGTAQPKVQLPAAVAKAIKDNCPTLEIAKVDVTKEEGVTLYDVEFTGTQGEIEIAEDGTVLDIATVIAMKDVPKAAADVIAKHAQGAKVTRVERSEVRAEIKPGGVPALVKLAIPKTVYEAELTKGSLVAEIQVAPDGTVVEAPDWNGKKDDTGEKEDAPKPKIKK
jgi:hypothetical protein